MWCYILASYVVGFWLATKCEFRQFGKWTADEQRGTLMLFAPVAVPVYLLGRLL